MLTKEETWARLRALHMAYGEMPKGRWDLVGFSTPGSLEEAKGVDLKGIDLSNANLGDA